MPSAILRSISNRASELPLANDLSKQISDLRVTLADMPDDDTYPTPPLSWQHQNATFRQQFDDVRETVASYRTELEDHGHGEFKIIGDSHEELATLTQAERQLAKVKNLTAPEDWYLNLADKSKIGGILLELQNLARTLPQNLEWHMRYLADDVRLRYRTWIVLTWVCAVATTFLTLTFVVLVYRWIFRPLRMLVKGSRRVAGGDFEYRIKLDSRDEMAELAAAMNDMTTRFRTIRDDLDRQVQLRTKQVVRSEQLASVGFLAAGVAHEINNPLASIALCAESLDGRLREICTEGGEHTEVVHRYLGMIQTEAFRCKEITEKLLDFSRLGEVKRQNADLGELVQGVIEMVRHLGKYQNRHIEFVTSDPVIAP